MRRKLLQSVLGLCLVASATDSFAQGSNLDLMGPRFFVNNPSALAGIKNFTFSSDANPGWGGALTSSYFNVDVVKGLDSLACGPITNDVNGKWVLIYRGTCEFGQKAKYCQDKGAAGVIIVNNIPGSPVPMGAGAVGGTVTIPVLMVSDVDGNALNSALNSSQSVKVSITRWGFNYGDDLAFIPNSEALPVGSIPYEQWKSGSPNAYKFYTGAFLANVGSNNQNNVKLKSTISFTPTGGSATQVYTDSVTTATFNSLDSAIELLSPRSTSLNPSSTGKYTVTYQVSSDATDQNPSDNTISFSVDVTSNVFSKVPLDANGNPIITGGIKAGTTVPLTWGPLYYVNTGNFAAQSVKMAVSDGDTNKHSLNTTVGSTNVYMFKWADGTGGGTTDGVIQSQELSLRGIASRTHTTADSNSQVFTAVMGDSVDGSPATVVLESNSWYWLAADLPDFVFLGINDNTNYFNRTNAAKNATAPVNDFWAPNFLGSVDAMISSSATIKMIPFGTTEANSANIDSADFTQGKSSTPAMALVLSPFNVSVKNIENRNGNISLYPNPATTNITVSIDLPAISHRAEMKIIDAVGKTMFVEKNSDIQNKTVTVNTSSLAPGNYYVVFFGDKGAIFKLFTIAGK